MKIMKQADEAEEMLQSMGIGNNKLKLLETLIEEKIGIK
jgi:putative GTP pyrophosphokinase